MPWGRGPFWAIPARPAGGWRAPWRPPHVLRARPPIDHYTRPIRAELDVSAGVKLNNAGAGFVTLAPDGMVIWDVRQAHVATTSGPTDGSECKLYRAGVYPHRQVAETAQGGGDSFDFAARLRPGDTLIAVWSGGVAGDAATLNLTGVLHAMAA